MDGFVELSKDKLDSNEGIAELNRMFQLLFSNISSDGFMQKVFQGLGSPEGAVNAEIGSLYMRLDGSGDTSLYKKASGVQTATGWVAVVAGSGSGAPLDSSYVVIASDGTLTSERVLTAGSNITKSDGGANSTVTLNAVPSGSDTHIQFNDGGVFGGESDLTWNKTSNILGINGDINFLDTTDATKNIKVVNQATANTVGNALAITGANGNGSAAGGAISITSGSPGSTLGKGGAINIVTANGVDWDGGAINITSGNGNLDGEGGEINITSGNGAGENNAGTINITSGNGDASAVSDGGQILISSGTGGASGAGGLVKILTGNPASGDAQGGDFQVFVGAGKGSGRGGAIDLQSGNGRASGAIGGFAQLLAGGFDANGGIGGDAIIRSGKGTSNRSGNSGNVNIFGEWPTTSGGGNAGNINLSVANGVLGGTNSYVQIGVSTTGNNGGATLGSIFAQLDPRRLTASRKLQFPNVAGILVPLEPVVFNNDEIISINDEMLILEAA